MYFFTFVSLALPISVSLIVAQNQYLVDSMEKSPLGLVKAKTRVLSSPQWLIMIGGTVVPDVKSAAVTGIPEGGGRTTEATRTKTDIPTGLEAGDGRVVPKSEISPASWAPKIVEGGVAVPFYVLLLAMFGAGINMTLKVPQIQRSYEDVLLEAPAFPLMNPLTAITATWRLLRGQPEAPGVVPVVVPRKTAGDIRQELIENYMYLLSAPLLAIAMYYLLQVMADQLTQPVLVIMAFATGLVSKAVIGGIINFAEDKLLGEKRRQREVSTQVSPEVAAKAEEAKTRQAEAEAAVRASEQATARKDAAEAAARAAEEDAAEKMQQRAAFEAAAGDGGGTQREADTAKEEAEKAAREAVAKQAEAKDAAETAARAAKEAEAKQVGARVAASEAQRAKAEEAAAHAEAAANVALEAAGKQSEARAATEATEEAAKVATEKQVVAEEAVRAVVQPMHAVAQEAKSIELEAQSAANATRAGAPPRSGAGADPTTKD
jgi:hypothetical protein